MAHCKPSDVRLIIQTHLEDHEIETLIELADTDLDLRLDGTSMTTNAKKLCSMRLTAIMISDNYPQSYAAGATRIDYGERVKRWNAQVNKDLGRALGRWHVVDPLEED